MWQYFLKMEKVSEPRKVRCKSGECMIGFLDRPQEDAHANVNLSSMRGKDERLGERTCQIARAPRYLRAPSSRWVAGWENCWARIARKSHPQRDEEAAADGLSWRRSWHLIRLLEQSVNLLHKKMLMQRSTWPCLPQEGREGCNWAQN
jgi:hypothetical protein